MLKLLKKKELRKKRQEPNKREIPQERSKPPWLKKQLWLLRLNKKLSKKKETSTFKKPYAGKTKWRSTTTRAKKSLSSMNSKQISRNKWPTLLLMLPLRGNIQRKQNGLMMRSDGFNKESVMRRMLSPKLKQVTTTRWLMMQVSDRNKNSKETTMH
jgi:hypothetical protein